MNRTRCPNCKEPLDDPRLIACPVCKTVFGEYEQTQLELLQQHREVLVTEAADRAWKRLRSRIGLWFAIFGALTGLGLIPIYMSLSHLIISRIAAQFDEPRIRETLTQVAGTHASKIIDERISPAIEDAQRSIEQARQSIENSFTDTKVRFDLATNFTMTVVAAQSDDRKAFDKLRVWADNTDYPFSSLATNVWLTVLEKHSTPMYNTGFNLVWDKDIDPSKLTIEEIRNAYEKETENKTYLKPALIEFVWNRNDIQKKDRMQFFIDIMEKDKSITAVEYAGRYFATAAGLNIRPLAVEYFVGWWKDNKDKL